MSKLSRRSFLRAAGTAAIGTAAVGAQAQSRTAASAGKPSASQRPVYTFFSKEEIAFVEPAVERLIPADSSGPGALDAGVPSFIDKQLGGAWGAGERLYRSGPWLEGSATQGYQLPFTPAELFRNALRGIRTELAPRRSSFARMTSRDQDRYLLALQTGKRDLGGVPSNVFFESLLGLTIEGYFSDPVYGGNKDMLAWKMIGFPGAYAAYYDLVDQHGISYTRAPVSLADNGSGVVDVHPDIPAYTDRKGL